MNASLENINLRWQMLRDDDKDFHKIMNLYGHIKYVRQSASLAIIDNLLFSRISTGK